MHGKICQLALQAEFGRGEAVVRRAICLWVPAFGLWGEFHSTFPDMDAEVLALLQPMGYHLCPETVLTYYLVDGTDFTIERMEGDNLIRNLFYGNKTHSNSLRSIVYTLNNGMIIMATPLVNARAGEVAIAARFSELTKGFAKEHSLLGDKGFAKLSSALDNLNLVLVPSFNDEKDLVVL